MGSFSQDLFYLTAHTHTLHCLPLYCSLPHYHHTPSSLPPGFPQNPSWLEEMIGYPTWRNLVNQLAEQFPDCLMLQFAIKVAVHHLSLFCHRLHLSTCQVWDAYVIKCHLSTSPSLPLPLPQCPQPSRHGHGTLGRGAHTLVCVCVPCSVSLCTPLPQVYEHYVDLDRVPPADLLRIPHFLGELGAPELVVM